MPSHSNELQHAAFSTQRISALSDIDVTENQYWRDESGTSLALDDWGALQGAVLVERLRTVHGRPLDAQSHLARLNASAECLGIDWPKYLTCKVIEECVRRNASRFGGTDFGIVVLLTPGHTVDKPAGKYPTVVVHAMPLAWSQLASWYSRGQPLVISNNRNVPPACWSPHIKTRSRLHYFLADRQAAQGPLPFTGALMANTEGYLTESSVANIMLVEGQRLVLPPSDSVLQGLSLQRTIRLAAALGIEVQYRAIEPEEARQADGMLLTGTSGCLWPASQLENKPYAQPTQLEMYRVLRDAWVDDLKLDYVAQAIANTAAKL